MNKTFEQKRRSNLRKHTLLSDRVIVETKSLRKNEKFEIMARPDLRPMLSQLAELSTKDTLLKLTLLSTILSAILLFSVILLAVKLRNKLVPFYGILWDKKMNSYCPSCKNLLSNYKCRPISALDSDDSFECIHCNKVVFLSAGLTNLPFDKMKETVRELMNATKQK